MNSKRGIRAWLQLLRLPNLLTVPGDPLAGFMLAGAAFHPPPRALLLAVFAALCFYAAGLVINDLVDIERDRAERPGRPLPSGGVSVRLARWAAVKLMALGILLCFLAGQAVLVVGLLLAAAILVYNLLAKNVPVFGPLAMGLCRGLSLTLGAVTASSIQVFPPLAAALFLVAYVAVVTRLARHEALGRPAGLNAWLPLLVNLSGLVLFVGLALAGDTRGLAPLVVCWLVAAVVADRAALRLAREGTDVPPIIGALVGALLLYQAAFCMTPGWNILGAMLLPAWPLFLRLGRTFNAS